jgi:integrase
MQGEDPAGAKRVARESPTFEEVASAYVERHAKAKKRSWREDQRILDHDVLPAWRTLKAKDITARDVRELLDTIVDRRAPIQANRTFSLIRKVFNWSGAPDRALVPQFHNPCRGIEAPALEHARERVLTDDEILQLWRALDAEDPYTAAIFKLHLLTAQRGGELLTMVWADVGLEAAWWTIPSERAKNGLAHRVPLSSQAVAILHALREQSNGSPWVFPSARSDGASGHRERVYAAVARIRQRSGVADFQPRDLRRTAASHMTGMGISRLVVGKILNHVEPGVTAVYDRHSYDREKREALGAWGERLEKIVATDPSVTTTQGTATAPYLSD